MGERNIETQPYENGFADFYENTIQPKLRRLSDDQAELRSALTRRRAIGLLGAGGVAGGGYIFTGERKDRGVAKGVGGGAVAAVTGIYAWTNGPAADHRATAKRGSKTSGVFTS